MVVHTHTHTNHGTHMKVRDTLLKWVSPSSHAEVPGIELRSPGVLGKSLHPQNLFEIPVYIFKLLNVVYLATTKTV